MINFSIPYQALGMDNPFWVGQCCQPLDGMEQFLPSVGQPGVVEERVRWIKTNYSHRARLVELLKTQHQRLAAPPASMRSIEQLAAPDAGVVVTGQQPGLGAGPMFCVYKALTAVALASQLQARYHIPVVPVFWNGCEDHDISESNSLWWCDRSHQWSQYTMDLSWVAPGTPIGLIPTNKTSLQPLHEWIVDRATGNLEPLLTMVRETFEASDFFADWFSRVLLALLPASGLVICNPLDREIRSLWLTVSDAERADPEASVRSFEETNHALMAAGWKPRIHKPRDRALFFVLRDGVRYPVVLTDTLAGVEQEQISPSAVLRPVFQDTALPVLATVLGPSEMSYHAQLSGVYARHGLPRPAVAGRWSATIIDQYINSLRARAGLEWEQLFVDQHTVLQTKARANFDQELQEILEQYRHTLGEVFGALAAKAIDIDPNLQRTIERELAKATALPDKLAHKIANAQASADTATAHRFTLLQQWVYPQTTPQERMLHPWQVWLKYGASGFDTLARQCPAYAEQEHGLVELSELDHTSP